MRKRRFLMNTLWIMICALTTTTAFTFATVAGMGDIGSGQPIATYDKQHDIAITAPAPDITTLTHDGTATPPAQQMASAAGEAHATSIVGKQTATESIDISMKKFCAKEEVTRRLWRMPATSDATHATAEHLKFVT